MNTLAGIASGIAQFVGITLLLDHKRGKRLIGLILLLVPFAAIYFNDLYFYLGSLIVPLVLGFGTFFFEFLYAEKSSCSNLLLHSLAVALIAALPTMPVAIVHWII